MSKMIELQQQLTEKQTAIEALIAKGEGLSVEELSSVKALDGELDVLHGQIKELKSLEEIQRKATERRNFIGVPAPGAPPLPSGQTETLPAVKTASYARPRASYMAKNFAGCERYAEGRSPAEQAYRFGMWFLAECKGMPHAKQWIQDHGVQLKTMYEGVNDSGGAVVPDEFENTLIDLREVYGVFRQYADVRPMAGDTKLVPRRVGGLTAYAVGEGATITTSDMQWDLVQLVAKKWATLSKLSSELNEDAVIDLGNTLAGEIAYAFSNVEDLCGFNGDGTSTYHNIFGVREKLKGLGTFANTAGLVVGPVTGGPGAPAAWTALIQGNFNDVVGRLPQYADTPNARWFCHRSFFFGVMQKMALAAGGVTAAEVTEGARTFRFLGYPVVFSQVMPGIPDLNQIPVLFGDLAKAALFGDRRMTQVALSEHSDFANDLIAIRGTERFDINVHDIGNNSATPALRVPGPIVGLITGAS